MNGFNIDIPGIDTKSIKVLSKEEMIDLFKKYRNGDKLAKEKLIVGNLKLVLSIIKKYNNGKNDMNDLFQIGCVGLIKAVDNFDISYDCLFSTYAVPLISGEVKRYIRDSSSLRISRSIRDLAFSILNYKEEYLNEYGNYPTEEEIIKYLDITAYEYMNALDSLKDPMSIYDPIYNDGGDTIYLLDQIEDDNKLDKDKLIMLKDALKKLKKRERDCLIKRNIIGKTQNELSEEFGVSQAQISRIEQSAINNVKKLVS